jgi:hypothetical protein
MTAALVVANLAALLIVGVRLRRSGGRPDARLPRSATPLSFRVFATREGAVGGTTANGHVITPHDHFVALPSRRALSPKDTKTYGVKVCADNGKCETAPVWDVGPWNTTDDCWSPPAVRTCLEAVEAWWRARRRDGVLIRLRAASTLGVREAAAWSLPGRRS